MFRCALYYSGSSALVNQTAGKWLGSYWTIDCSCTVNEWWIWLQMPANGGNGGVRRGCGCGCVRQVHNAAWLIDCDVVAGWLSARLPKEIWVCTGICGNSNSNNNVNLWNAQKGNSSNKENTITITITVTTVIRSKSGWAGRNVQRRQSGRADNRFGPNSARLSTADSRVFERRNRMGMNYKIQSHFWRAARRQVLSMCNTM